MPESRAFPALVLALAAAPGFAQSSTTESLDDCLVCHGTDARGNPAIGAPALVPLGADYLRRQLEGYRSGRRGRDGRDVFGAEMQPIAALLDDGEIELASRYFQTMPAAALEPTLSGDAQFGAQLYAGCAACHGEDGGGRTDIGAPPLRGQRDWYLERQMLGFREGWRGGDPDDDLGALMSAAAQNLDDDAVRDVVAYINTLSAQEHETRIEP